MARHTAVTVKHPEKHTMKYNIVVKTPEGDRIPIKSFTTLNAAWDYEHLSYITVEYEKEEKDM